jgi:hypothetical protein
MSNSPFFPKLLEHLRGACVGINAGGATCHMYIGECGRSTHFDHNGGVQQSWILSLLRESTNTQIVGDDTTEAKSVNREKKIYLQE